MTICKGLQGLVMKILDPKKGPDLKQRFLGPGVSRYETECDLLRCTAHKGGGLHEALHLLVDRGKVGRVFDPAHQSTQ
jgi:hypothetical protein